MSDDGAFGLPAHSVTALRGVLARHRGVERAVVYGSRARGSARPASDIDLTLEGEALTVSDLLRIEAEIDDLLLPYKVDLSLRHQIEDPAVREHIARVGRALYPA